MLRRYFFAFVIGITISPFVSFSQRTPVGFTSKYSMGQFDSLYKNHYVSLFGDPITYFIKDVKDFTHSIFTYPNGKTVSLPLDSLGYMFRTNIEPLLTKKPRLPFDEAPLPTKKTNFEILNRIKEIRKIPADKRDKVEIREIGEYIVRMGTSYDKVLLFVTYQFMQTKNNDVRKNLAIFDTAKRMSEQIIDPYKKAQAFRVIGDFATHYRYEDEAVRMYYLARENIDDTKLPFKAKSREQGILCQKIAWVFSRSTLDKSQQKFLEYFFEARKYFDDARDFVQSDKALMLTIGNSVYYCLNLKQSANLDSQSILLIDSMLRLFQKALVVVYAETKGGATYLGDEGCYFLYYSIAALLRYKGFHSSALIYYLQALHYAIRIGTKGIVTAALENVAIQYSLLGNEELTHLYAYLDYKVSENDKEYIHYYQGLFSRVYELANLRKYDEALRLANIVLNDSTQLRELDWAYRYEVYRDAYRAKATVLRNMQHDSAYYYQTIADNYEMDELDKFSGTIRAEQEASANWTIRIKEKTIVQKDVEINQKIREIARINSKIETLNTAVLNLNDSIEFKNELNIKLQKDINDLVKDTARLSETINTQEDSIQKQRNDIKLLDRQRESLESTKANLLIWTKRLIAGLVVLLISLYFSGKRLVKQRLKAKGLKSQIEANRIMHETELMYEDEKVRREYGLKHEIVEIFNNLRNAFDNLLREISPIKESLTQPFNKYKDKLTKTNEFASAYYASLAAKNQYNSIDSEISLSRKYIDFIQILANEQKVLLEDERKTPNPNALVPPHMINNFVKNSIEKGVATRITISDSQDDNDYLLHIIDNGIGIGDNFKIERIGKNSSGIKGIIALINYYNSRKEEPYDILLDDKSFIDLASQGEGKGTRVSIRFRQKTV